MEVEKIAALALDLLKNDPGKYENVEFRIAAYKMALAGLEAELTRQAVMAAMAKQLHS